MTRRKQNQIVERNPWDVEAAYWTIKVGLHPDQAQAFTIIRWMWNGRPLAAARESSAVKKDRHTPNASRGPALP
jgi:hypothetical protein